MRPSSASWPERRGSSGGGELRLFAGHHRMNRQSAGDRRALTLAAGDAQGATVQFHQSAGDGKAKPAALVALGELVFDLLERATEFGDVGLRNADAGVLDSDLHPAARARQVHVDAAAVARELDGVGQKIEKHLLERA